MAVNLFGKMRSVISLNCRISVISQVNRYSRVENTMNILPRPCRPFNCTMMKIDQNRLNATTVSPPLQLYFIRFKSKKGKNSSKRVDTLSDDESDDENQDEAQDDELPGVKDYKDINANLNSLRIDGVLKAGLGIPKAKIEEEFYDSKIYVNGKKALKKSYQAHVGDEVDLIIGPSSLNPEFLQVARVVINKIEQTDSGKIIVKLRRFKNLLVEDYTKV